MISALMLPLSRRWGNIDLVRVQHRRLADLPAESFGTSPWRVPSATPKGIRGPIPGPPIESVRRDANSGSRS